jgi:predicted O-methyltransferase YrrM
MNKISATAQKILEEIETQSPNGEKFWQIPMEVGEFMHNLIVVKNYRCALEIGTSVGFSGIIIASALRETNGKLITIESNSKRFEIAKENFAKAQLSELISQVKGHAPQVFTPDELKNEIRKKDGTLHESNLFKAIFADIKFDFVFLDCAKGEYQNCFQSLTPLLKTGGTIIADNVVSHGEMLNEFLQYCRNLESFKCELNPIGKGILICEKS